MERRIDISEQADDLLKRWVGIVCPKSTRVVDQDGMRADRMIRNSFQFCHDGSIHVPSCCDAAAEMAIQPEDTRAVNAPQQLRQDSAAVSLVNRHIGNPSEAGRRSLRKL